MGMVMSRSEAQPHRVQLSRAKGWRMPANTVKVDRGTRWGNPFNATQSYMAVMKLHGVLQVPLVPLLGKPSLERCLDMHAAYVRGRLDADPAWLEPLRGKNLACWCSLDQDCHADTLLRLANVEPRA